jgi:hypothetical protein
MHVLKAAIRPAYQQFERIFDSAPGRLYPNDDTLAFLDDPVARGVATRELSGEVLPEPTPVKPKGSNPSICELTDNPEFKCAEARQWRTDESKTLSCQNMLALMKRFLDKKKHPQMTKYFESRQGSIDTDITLNTFCKICKTFYSSKINRWYTCYRDLCAEDHNRYAIFHATLLKNGV